MKRTLVLFLAAMAVCLNTFAQDTLPVRELRADHTIRVYFDAPWFDMTYIKRNITFINYVNDRMDADLHILVTRESTGSGGLQYTIEMVGQQMFQGRRNVVQFVTFPFETDDEIRKKFVQNLMLGLIPFITGTPLKDSFTVAYSEPEQKDTRDGQADKWKGWVFYTAINGWLSFQEQYQNINIWSSLSAGQIRDRWKHQFWLNNNYNESNYEFEDHSYRTITRSLGAYTRSVKSLDSHWSLGEMAGASSSTYSNTALNLYLQPAVEYNLYPYDQSNHRRFGFTYSLGPRFNQYYDTTIYDRTQELYLRQSLDIKYYIIKTWGNISAYAGYSSLVPDFGKYRISSNFNLSLRIIRGFSLNLSGGGSIIRDQIGLPRRGATDEEVLLQKKALKSNYNAYMNFGVSYRFGSIYNNIVNPRFEL